MNRKKTLSLSMIGALAAMGLIASPAAAGAPDPEACIGVQPGEVVVIPAVTEDRTETTGWLRELPEGEGWEQADQRTVIDQDAVAEVLHYEFRRWVVDRPATEPVDEQGYWEHEYTRQIPNPEYVAPVEEVTHQEFRYQRSVQEMTDPGQEYEAPTFEYQWSEVSPGDGWERTGEQEVLREDVIETTDPGAGTVKEELWRKAVGNGDKEEWREVGFPPDANSGWQPAGKYRVEVAVYTYEWRTMVDPGQQEIPPTYEDVVESTEWVREAPEGEGWQQVDQRTVVDVEGRPAQGEPFLSEAAWGLEGTFSREWTATGETRWVKTADAVPGQQEEGHWDTRWAAQAPGDAWERVEGSEPRVIVAGQDEVTHEEYRYRRTVSVEVSPAREVVCAPTDIPAAPEEDETDDEPVSTGDTDSTDTAAPVLAAEGKTLPTTGADDAVALAAASAAAVLAGGALTVFAASRRRAGNGR